MSKTARISNRIKRIEDRFKIKVSKGRKGTDMDIEIHERRIDKLRGKHREETLKHESQHSALHRKSPLGFIMPHSPLNQNDSIAASKSWDNFKSGYMTRTHKFKGRKNERPLTTEENLAEYNREKHEFYYSPKERKLTYIPTDDGEVPIKGFKENLKKWQLPPLNK